MPLDLNPVELRVIGCLIEKERATPQNYPLTLNSLRLACNQSTNRDPVVDYDDGEIEAALMSLREQKLTRIVHSTSNRAAKYRQVLHEHLHLRPDEMAALGVLLLRGPQTLGEIKARADRLHDFADLAEVQDALERLAAHDEGPLAERLERRPGQKDARYVHRLGAGDPTAMPAAEGVFNEPGAFSPQPAASPMAIRPDTPAPDTPASPSGTTGAPVTAAVASAAGADHAAVAALTDEVERLRDELEQLRAEFEVFRTQFD